MLTHTPARVAPPITLNVRPEPAFTCECPTDEPRRLVQVTGVEHDTVVVCAYCTDCLQLAMANWTGGTASVAVVDVTSQNDRSHTMVSPAIALLAPATISDIVDVLCAWGRLDLSAQVANFSQTADLAQDIWTAGDAEIIETAIRRAAHDAAVNLYLTACASAGVEPDPNEEAIVGARAVPGWAQ